jgi:hypothetical protein
MIKIEKEGSMYKAYHTEYKSVKPVYRKTEFNAELVFGFRLARYKAHLASIEELKKLLHLYPKLAKDVLEEIGDTSENLVLEERAGWWTDEKPND